MVLAVILASAAGIAAIDQIIKYFIVEYLAPVHTVSVIDNLLSLVYVENRGVAFGMLQNHVWIFAVITFLLIGAMIYLIAAKKFKGKLFAVSSFLLIGGGIGNLIDRLFRGYVVDYLQLSFFPPVCNFADYCITIGAAIFIIVMILSPTGENKKVNETSYELTTDDDSNPDSPESNSSDGE